MRNMWVNLAMGLGVAHCRYVCMVCMWEFESYVYAAGPPDPELGGR